MGEMEERRHQDFSEHVAVQFGRFKQWLKPDLQDPVALWVVKTFLKSIAVLLLLLFSPVMLVALVLGFIGLL
jgi:lipopolysaccharide/colanic/teichoic acid biosynthesis glycosyltransferase